MVVATWGIVPYIRGMFWIAVLAIYALMSLITVAFYGLDKYRATTGGWRIPERTLHTLELIGGWPGALVAQQVFRHKRQKTRFMGIFYAIVAMHVLIWVGAFLLLRK